MGRKKDPKNCGCPEIQRFKLSGLNPATYNPRTISDEALAGLARSIEKFGCVEPIVVNVRAGKNIVIGGHQRLKVLKTAGVKEALCVVVNLAETDEKLLNLSLNNRQIQGRFVEAIGDYIESLKSNMTCPEDLLDLKIEQLQEEIYCRKESMKYQEESLRPFRKTHVLLSFEPSVLSKIQGFLEEIIKTEGVEYEQGSN